MTLKNTAADVVRLVNLLVETARSDHEQSYEQALKDLINDAQLQWIDDQIVLYLPCAGDEYEKTFSVRELVQSYIQTSLAAPNDGDASQMGSAAVVLRLLAKDIDAAAIKVDARCNSTK